MTGPGAAVVSSRPSAAAEPAPELSVVVVLPAGVPPTPGVVPAVAAAVETFGCTSEFVIVAPPRDAEAARAAWPTAPVLTAPGDGYGVALAHALHTSRGEWVLLVDADLREPGPAAAALWAARHRGEVLIGSRFVDGASVRMPALRRGLSRGLNRVFKRGLSLGVRDLSSATRLLRRTTIAPRYDARGFDILQELLVRAYADGWRVVEVPIAYEAAHPEAAYPRALGVGADYVRRFWALWKLRNSILAADYDDRAHDSAIPLQRYWQRQRFKHITELVRGEGRVLDVGCGSSRIIGALVPGSVCLDVLRRKLRYARRFNRALVHGSGFTLPVPDASFPCVLCSQVIEHVPEGVADPEGARSRARARRPPRARHARLRALGVGGHREAVRMGGARRLRRRAHRPLHARGADRPLHRHGLDARGHALHPPRRADPRVSQAALGTRGGQGAGVAGASSMRRISPTITRKATTARSACAPT